MAEHQVEGNEGVVDTILLYRIYDVLSVMLSNLNPTDWETVMKAHEAGMFVTPLPSISLQPTGDEDAD